MEYGSTRLSLNEILLDINNIAESEIEKTIRS